MYNDANGSYPTTGFLWWGECTDGGSHSLTGVNGYIPNLSPTYVNQLPLDPQGHNAQGKNYGCYFYISNAADYKLIAYTTMEIPLPITDPFYDTARPGGSTAQVSTSGAINW